MIKSIEHNGRTYWNVPADGAGLGLPAEVLALALAQQAHADAVASRSAAYVAESDPLYLEWQYDQTPEAEQAWRDKVAEIKARYPLPTE